MWTVSSRPLRREGLGYKTLGPMNSSVIELVPVCGSVCLSSETSENSTINLQKILLDQ